MSVNRLARILAVPALLTLMVALAACGATEQNGGEQQEQAQEEPEPENGQDQATAPETTMPETTGPAMEQTGGMELTEAGDEATGAGASGAAETAAGEPAEVRDGVWAVGDAGEVEFTVENGSLTLDDARPNQGWDVEIDEESPDEIEVDFEQGNVEWEFEVETDGNELEIEIDQDIEPAEPGAYEIADAGTVEISTGGGGLSLVDASANEGWNVSVSEETAEEIEVEFAQGDVDWDFDAELDDGELDVEIDQEITGPIPN